MQMRAAPFHNIEHFIAPFQCAIWQQQHKATYTNRSSLPFWRHQLRCRTGLRLLLLLVVFSTSSANHALAFMNHWRFRLLGAFERRALMKPWRLWILGAYEAWALMNLKALMDLGRLWTLAFISHGAYESWALMNLGHLWTMAFISSGAYKSWELMIYTLQGHVLSPLSPPGPYYRFLVLTRNLVAVCLDWWLNFFPTVGNPIFQ